MSEKIVLIDGHSILNRAFYGLPDLTNSEGLHTNGVYGFLNIMTRILEEEKPQYLTVAFDVHAPTFRHQMYGEYKGTRKAMPQELREQVPLIRQVLEAMGVCIVSMEGYEADDLLGTIAKRGEARGLEVTVVSGDRDLLQLATDRIQVRIPKTRGGRTVIEDYHTAQVVEKYQVTPPQIIELKALMGDTADNIPGIPGVGEKQPQRSLQSTVPLRMLMSIWRRSGPTRQRNLSGHITIWRYSAKSWPPSMWTVRWNFPGTVPGWGIYILRQLTRCSAGWILRICCPVLRRSPGKGRRP